MLHLWPEQLRSATRRELELDQRLPPPGLEVVVVVAREKDKALRLEGVSQKVEQAFRRAKRFLDGAEQEVV